MPWLSKVAKTDVVGSNRTPDTGGRPHECGRAVAVLCFLLAAILAASCLPRQSTPTPSGSYDLMLMGECRAEATQQAKDAERYKAEYRSRVGEAADPRWYQAEMVDARSGQAFTLEGLQGETVMVEAMAVWCGLCLQQQLHARDMFEEGVEGVVFVSLDIDPNESAEVLAEHAMKHHFDWRFAIAPREVSQALRQQFGSSVLNPSAVPVIIIDRNRQARLLPLGLKSVDFLVEEIVAVGGR
jgi:thiol-disulfide isomerase/thioredoxin